MKAIADSVTSNNRKLHQISYWEIVEQTAGDWFVIHAKSRQEKALSQTLNTMGITHFLPLVTKIRYNGKRKFTAEVPLFPSYLFLRGELDDAYFADRTKRISRIICANDQEQIHNELRSIYLATTEKALLEPYPYLENGIRVEVRSGPFKGIQGVVESRIKANRLIMQIETLGQATSIEIDASLLDTLE